MTESPEEFYSKGAEKFAEKNARENLPENFKDFIDTFLQKIEDGRILDAGCGPGRDVEYFLDRGFDAIGIDNSERMIEYARKNGQVDYRERDVRNLDFPDEEFDGVFCNTVLLLFPKEEMVKILEEIKRVIKTRDTFFWV